MSDAINLAPPHQGHGLRHRRWSMGHANTGARLHVADCGAAEGRIVLIDHGDRGLTDHSRGQHRRDDHQQDQRQAKGDERVPPSGHQEARLVPNGRYKDGREASHRADQSNSTLMPGLRPLTGRTGLALT